MPGQCHKQGNFPMVTLDFSQSWGEAKSIHQREEGNTDFKGHYLKEIALVCGRRERVSIIYGEK